MGCGSSTEVEKCNFDEKDKVCNKVDIRRLRDERMKQIVMSTF